MSESPKGAILAKVGFCDFGGHFGTCPFCRSKSVVGLAGRMGHPSSEIGSKSVQFFVKKLDSAGDPFFSFWERAFQKFFESDFVKNEHGFFAISEDGRTILPAAPLKNLSETSKKPDLGVPKCLAWTPSTPKIEPPKIHQAQIEHFDEKNEGSKKS